MVLSGLAAGTAVFAAALWINGTFDSRNEWRQRLDQDVPLFSISKSAAVSEGSITAQTRIFNDVLRRPNWGEAEAAELCAILRRGYPKALSERRSLSREEMGAAMVHSAASVALLARLEVGGPMTDEARRMIVHSFAEELSAEFAERRCNAAMALIVSKSIEDPFVRAEVERLTEDSDAETAEIIAMQLAHYDDQRTRALALGARVGGE